MDSNILNVKRKADDETADEVKNHHQPKRNKGNSDTTMNKSVLEEKDRARRSAVLEEIRASGQQVSDARFQREIEDAQLRVLQNLERDGRVRLVASRMHYYTDFWVWCSRFPDRPADEFYAKYPRPTQDPPIGSCPEYEPYRARVLARETAATADADSPSTSIANPETSTNSQPTGSMSVDSAGVGLFPELEARFQAMKEEIDALHALVKDLTGKMERQKNKSPKDLSPVHENNLQAHHPPDSANAHPNQPSPLPIPDGSECAWCMQRTNGQDLAYAKSHQLVGCVWPTFDGDIPGCPRCNTMGHCWDDCPARSPMSDAARFADAIDFLVRKRARLPPIRTTVAWPELATHLCQDSPDGYPATKAFVRAQFKDNRAAFKFFHANKHWLKLPKDPATATIAEIQEDLAALNVSEVSVSSGLQL